MAGKINLAVVISIVIGLILEIIRRPALLDFLLLAITAGIVSSWIIGPLILLLRLRKNSD
jgi:hypothetical protein